MTLKRIRQLTALLPADSNYLTHINSRHNRRTARAEWEIDVWAYIRNDPRFCFEFVKSFTKVCEPLPAEVVETSLWRYHDFVLTERPMDFDILEACALDTYHQRTARTLIECLLMHPQTSFEGISKLMGYSLKTVRMYHDLFFNVRDRITVDHDEAYILQLIYPDSRQVEFMPGYPITENWMTIAKRIMYTYGLHALCQWLGSRAVDRESCGAETAKVMESRFLTAGKFAMNAGFHHQQGVAAIGSARGLLQSAKIGGADAAGDDMTKGLMKLSMDEGLMATFYETVTGDAFKRLDAKKLMTTPVSELVKQRAVAV